MSQVIQILGSILMACVPAYLWGYIYYHKQPEDRKLTTITFIFGSLMVFPILIYKFLWQFFPWISAFRYANYFSADILDFHFVHIPLSVIITFMFVGVLEESLKLLPVKFVDQSSIRNIDDSIEFFIIAALGFAFTENILYFYNIWVVDGPSHLFLPFLFRSSFSTFAHLMFSGIFGYYYGTAHFAKPMLQKELRENRRYWTVLLHKLFNLRQVKLFHEERILEGLLIAVGLHALFNIFLEANLTFIIAPFLVSGYIALNYLFAKRENHKNFGKLYEGTRNHAFFGKNA